jgi:hypothetical protein
VAERLIAPVLKTGEGESPPGVRIPPCPPVLEQASLSLPQGREEEPIICGHFPNAFLLRNGAGRAFCALYTAYSLELVTPRCLVRGFKAVRLQRPIRNNSKFGDAVFEPFSGSGTTIIAIENKKRRSYAGAFARLCRGGSAAMERRYWQAGNAAAWWADVAEVGQQQDGAQLWAVRIRL